MSLLAILLASILGSVHCAGMCGGFALFCSGAEGKKPAASLFYNFGRLFTYALLGAAAGAAGEGADSLIGRAGISNSLPVALGILLVLLGVAQLFGWRGVTAPASPGLVAIARRGIERVGRFPSALKGLVVGCSSTLLPCGWLYSFLLVAAASGSASRGALTMAVFWIGTVPMMLAIGEFSRRLLLRWGAQVPAVTAALLIAAGLLSIGAHAGMVPGPHQHCSMHEGMGEAAPSEEHR